jgi:pimeloyl-ACP methyl ester carboxylesterase
MPARFVRLDDGRRIRVRTSAGSGLPVVLLHGLLDCAEGWDRLARALPNPCLAFDLPGFGDSDLPTRPRISAYADDVLAALARLGVDRYLLVGHSLGGAVATAMAERAQRSVAALVLLAPAGYGRVRLAEAVSVPGVRNLTAALLPRALASTRTLNVAYSRMISNGGALDAGTLRRTKDRALAALPGAREATRAVVAAGLSKRGFHTRRVRYDGPVLVVWGDRDRIVPAGHARAVLRSLPQAELEIWGGMGHHPQHERPEQLQQLVARACVAATAPARRSRAA